MDFQKRNLFQGIEAGNEIRTHDINLAEAVITGGGSGLRWDSLDMDYSVFGLVTKYVGGSKEVVAA